MTSLRLVGRDLLRSPLRTLLTVLAGAVGVTAFIFLRTVVDLWYSGVQTAQVDRLIVRNRVAITQPLPLAYLQRIAAVPGVVAVTYQAWFGGMLGESRRDFLPSFAVEPGSFLHVYPEYVVPPAQQAAFAADPCGALVGRSLAERQGWQPGQQVTLRSSTLPGEWTFTVRGIYAGTRADTDTGGFYFGYRCLNERAPEALRDKVGIYAVRVDDPARSAAVSAAIDGMFTHSAWPTVTESERAFQLGFLAMSSAILAAVQAVSAVILLILLLVVGNTIALSVRERTRELATLRALGFRARRVVLLVLAQAALLGVASALVGALASPLLIGGFVRVVEARFGSLPGELLRPSTLVLSALVAVGVALLAGVLPALRAARLSVAEGLRKVA